MVDVEIDVDGGTGVVEEIGVDGDEAKVSFSLISRVAFLRETIMLNKIGNLRNRHLNILCPAPRPL